MRTDDADSAEEAVAALRLRIAPILSAAQLHAQALDELAEFPAEDVAALRAAGLFGACLPTLMGGLGIGTEAARAAAAADVLQAVGAASVALGRIFEGHLNAVRLVVRQASPAQCRGMAADVRAGHLFALWVTDGEDPLRYRQTGQRIELDGEKRFCSAAGHASRAVVTAQSACGATRLALLPLQAGETVRALPAGLAGVRSATTGSVRFAGVRHPLDAVFGPPDIYLQEPEFSAGAWRASAVAAGALSSLVEAASAELVARGRAQHPDQVPRLGDMFVQARTARLWVQEAARLAEDADRQPELAVASVHLARTAVEAACLRTIPLVQRSLGMSAFMRNNPVERIGRDLATYLRQPAPDEALREAAAYFIAHPAGVA